jgi:tRNA threonylcarbamoyladenosine biosynthesis protein TsaE
MRHELALWTWSPEATRKLASTIAGALRPGDVVTLTGELGAGKTVFVQGAAAALGVIERVTSASFLLRRQYEGNVPVLHIDVFRLDTLQDVIDIGYEDALDGRHVTFIEWGDAISPLLPPNYLEVEFRLPDPDSRRQAPGAVERAGPGPAQGFEDERRIFVRPRGDDWVRRCVGLAADLQPWRVTHEES